MSDARDMLVRRIDAERERLVRFFQDFVRIDTSNPPGDTRSIQFSGNDVTGVNDWNKIAGEQLTITLRGIRLGTKELRQQSVTFVPENPMMKGQ